MRIYKTHGCHAYGIDIMDQHGMVYDFILLH